MPFGRSKKEAAPAADADDSSRAALFANRKGGGGGGENPYAQGPPPSDPYSQRPPPQNYSRPTGGLPSGPKGRAGGLPAGPRGGGGLPGGPAPRKSGNPYGNEKAGANPYGAAPPKSGNPYGEMQEGDRYSGGGGGGRGGGDRYDGGGGEDRYGGGGGAGGGDRYGGGGGDRAASGYGANRYGGQSGYGGGGDRYGTGGGRGADRYGAGRGGRYGEDDEADRSALFGGAQDRYAKRQAGGGPPPPYSEQGESGGGGYGSSYGDANYGDPGPRYQERQLTAEEQEEEEVQAVKDQIRNLKREDVSSTRNALRIAAMAEETGRDTLTRLGQQGEHIHTTEKNLDLAHNQNRLAEERARELKTLNKSMFAVHVSNPFTSGSRSRQRDQDVIDKHLEERERREATRQAAFQSEARMAKAMHDIDNAAANRQGGQRSLAERAKYQFEADSEDEEMENEIDANLDALHGAAGRLNKLARATGQEVDEQIKHLDRIAEKSDRVDLGLAANQARLDRFK